GDLGETPVRGDGPPPGRTGARLSDAVLAEYPKTVVLKDGRHLVLRAAVPADGPALAALVARRADSSGGLSDPGGTVVLAVDGELIAGAARLAPAGSGCARVAVAVDPDYEGQR